MKILSLHIPKTAGTTLYKAWTESGMLVSPKLRRKDIQKILKDEGGLHGLLEYDIIHGHFYWSEIATWIQENDLKLVVFLRNPVDRVVSNYRFFMDGLRDPERNPEQYELNKHRLNEGLLEYASLAENRNRLAQHLGFEGLEVCSFVGFVEFLREDVARIMNEMGLSTSPIASLNKSRFDLKVSPAERERIELLNDRDMKLYSTALAKSIHQGHI